MSNNSSNQNETSPEISPETVAVIKRAKRSFLIMIGLLIIGLVAVAIAIVYRTDGKDESASSNNITNYSAGMIVVPDGADILSAIPSEGMFAIAYSVNGKIRLRLIDGTTGAIIRDIDFIKQ